MVLTLLKKGLYVYNVKIYRESKVRMSSSYERLVFQGSNVIIVKFHVTISNGTGIEPK